MEKKPLDFVPLLPEDTEITDRAAQLMEMLNLSYNKLCYSFRIDVLEDETTTLNDILAFFKKFEIYQYAIAFENKSKSNSIEVKPHYHSFFYSNKQHDTMRRYLSNIGYTGSLAMLLQSSKKYDIIRTVTYTLKHGQVPLNGFCTTHFTQNDIQVLVLYSIIFNSKLSHNASAEAMNVVIQTFQNLIGNENVPDKDKYQFGSKLIKDQVFYRTIYNIYRKSNAKIPVGYKLKELALSIGNAIYDEDDGYAWFIYLNNSAVIG